MDRIDEATEAVREGEATHAVWRLGFGQCLGLRNVTYRVVVCHSGELWVTQEGDFRDIELKAGESFCFDRRGLAVITVCSQAAVIEVERRPPSSRNVLADACLQHHTGARPTQYELHRWAKRRRAEAMAAALERLIECGVRRPWRAFKAGVTVRRERRVTDRGSYV